MSKYRSDSFYFLKLFDSFLNGDTMRWIEKQEDGEKMVLTFLRLMMIAKNRNGKLVRMIGKMEEPYITEEIAIETFQEVDFIEKALVIFEKADLIEKKENSYYVPKVLEYTNQTTVGAIKKQQYRKRKVDKEADNCLTDIEEIDLEKENRNKKKEKEKEYILEEASDFHYNEIIFYLNRIIGSNYNENSKTIRQLITKQINEGYTEQDFINVINKKYKEWRDTEYEKYLRPETLFGDKFELYVNQKEETY